MERNAIIDTATAVLGDFIKENPDNKAEAQADARRLRSEKLTDHEAEMTKINSTFVAILRDIKKDIDDGKSPEQPATVDFLQSMREQIQTARQEQKPVCANDVISAMMNMIRQTVQLDEKTSELFKQLARNVLAKSFEKEM